MKTLNGKLNDEALAEVAAGCYGDGECYYLADMKEHKGKQITKYETELYIGHKLIVKKSDNTCYVGILTASYEHPEFFGKYSRRFISLYFPSDGVTRTVKNPDEIWLYV